MTTTATRIHTALQTQHLTSSPRLAEAYGAATAALIAIITEMGHQIEAMEAQVVTHFGRHPDSEIYLSQPGLGKILGARVLGEFGDAANRYTNAKARRNYAGTSPITRASGKKLVVLARYARNKRLADALFQRTTTACEPAESATTTPCDACPTASSASCTAAWPATPPTKRRLPGPTAPAPPSSPPLDS